MCNTSVHHRLVNGVVDPFSFSTFHLLSTCNQLLLPSPAIESYHNIVRDNINTIQSNLCSNDIYNATEVTTSSPILDVIESIPLSDEDLEITDSDNPPNVNDNLASYEPFLTMGSTEPNAQTTLNHKNISMPSRTNNKPHRVNNNSSLPTFEYIAPSSHRACITSPLHTVNESFPLMELDRVGVGVALGVRGNSLLFPGFLNRRPRGEKRPIPDEQKDDKYYERRKRNNEAAKKSRDARKIREDRIAFRAALLEQENSILRAQLMALRDEVQTLRQLMSVAAAPMAPQRIGIAT